MRVQGRTPTAGTHHRCMLEHLWGVGEAPGLEAPTLTCVMMRYGGDDDNGSRKHESAVYSAYSRV